MRHLSIISLLGLLTLHTACGEASVARAQEPAHQAAPDASAKPQSAATPAPAEGVVNAPGLVRFELAESVEAREPVHPGQSFAQGAKVHAFLELSNKDGALSALVVKFEREGGKPGNGVRLEVPALKRYRTHAFTTSTSKPGRYRCTVSTEDGQVVAQKDFEIVAAPQG